MGRLVEDGAVRRAALAGAGRRKVEKDYSFAVRMDKLRKLYDLLLRHKPTLETSGLEKRETNFDAHDSRHASRACLVSA
jgi:hypothetical protein